MSTTDCRRCREAQTQTRADVLREMAATLAGEGDLGIWLEGPFGMYKAPAWGLLNDIAEALETDKPEEARGFGRFLGPSPIGGAFGSRGLPPEDVDDDWVGDHMERDGGERPNE